MRFDIHQFLRKTPQQTLQTYFNRKEPKIDIEVDWETDPRSFLKTMRENFKILPDDQLSTILIDFENVHHLSSEVGRRALRSVLVTNPKLLERVDNAVCEQERAIIVLIEGSNIFERALSYTYTEKARSSRIWDAYRLPHPCRISANPEANKVFESELTSIFQHDDGSGRNIKVDNFDQLIATKKKKDAFLIRQCSIYVEDLPTPILQFEGRQLQNKIMRPIHEASIIHDVDSDGIEVICRGGKDIRRAIIHSYARNMLGISDALMLVSPRNFDLSPLKKRHRFPTDPSDSIKSVHVISLRLNYMPARFGRVTIETDKAEKTDIYATSSGWFGNFNPLESNLWKVERASLRIVFHPQSGTTREKIVRVNLNMPNCSNLKEQTDKHCLVAEKYLELWGLLETPS